MTELRSMPPMWTRRQLWLLAAIVAALVVGWLVFANASDQPDGPIDTRSCAELSEAFAIYSKLISEHDRSWSQWEAVDTEKWAAYDAYHDKDCG